MLLGDPDERRVDYVRALKHAERAQVSLPVAGFEVGLILSANRPGVTQDPPRAAAAIRTAANAGHGLAQYMYGVMLEAGYGGLARDEAAALQWFTRSADQGVSPARLRTGEALAFGQLGSRIDRERGVRLLEEAAEGGERAAVNLLGEVYAASAAEGDRRRAVQYFTKAAELGDPAAQSNLGLAYLTGFGVPEDAARGSIWLSKSAASGYAPGQYALGVSYLARERDRDEESAVRSITASAGQGFAPAMNQLCELAFLQRGGLRLDGPAASWLTAGVRQGQPACLYVEALRIERGFSRPAESTSVDLLRRAAELGYHYAELDLGQLYLLGRHVPLDPNAGRAWLERAAAHGNLRARQLLDQAGLN
jgi:TPR repeat protein